MEIKNLKLWFGLGVTCVSNAMVTVLPENFNWIGWPLLVIGLAILMLAFHEWVFNRLGWKLHFRKPHMSILVPLKSSTAKIREIHLDRGFSLFEVLGSKELNCGEDSRFDHIAEYLADGAKRYGKRDRSDIVRLIVEKYDKTTGKREFIICEDGNSLKTLSGEITFTDIMIEKAHLKQYIKNLKRD